MPIVSAQGAPIPNAGPALTGAQRTQAITAIQSVQLADVWRYGVKIADTPAIRVDSQLNHAPGFANLQAQINGMGGNSTVANVLVADSVGTTSGSAAAAQATYAINQIRGALQNSLSSGTVITLTGYPT